MPYTTPYTFVAGDPLTAAQLNAVQANISYLKSPSTGVVNVNNASDYTTTSTTIVDIDAATLVITITTYGGRVLLGFTGTVLSTGNGANFDFIIDGALAAGNDGLLSVGTATDGTYTVRSANCTMLFLTSALSAGSHQFKVAWKSPDGGTIKLWAGAGSASGKDTHPQFWAREV